MADKQSVPVPQFRSSEIVHGPTTTGQNQCVGCLDRADQLSAWGFRGWCLEAQRRLFSIFRAGSAKVRRLSGAVSCWLLAEYDDGPMSQLHGLIVGKLLTLTYRSAQLSSKLELLFQRRLKLSIQEQLLALQRQYRSLRFNQSSEEICSGCRHLARITFGNESFCDCFSACDGRDGQLNFVEHGCPSGQMVRVEELALSSGVGARPIAEVTHV